MSRKVTIACKIPNGLVLRLFEAVDQRVPAGAGQYIIEKLPRQKGDIVHVSGCAIPRGPGESPKAPISGGYALTHGVDAEFWEQWLKQNADSDIVKNKLIFAFDKPEDVQHETLELKSQLSGLQPMDMAMVKRGDRTVARDERVPRQGALTIEKGDAK